MQWWASERAGPSSTPGCGDTVSKGFQPSGTVLTLQEQIHWNLITTPGGGYYYFQCTSKKTVAPSVDHTDHIAIKQWCQDWKPEFSLQSPHPLLTTKLGRSQQVKGGREEASSKQRNLYKEKTQFEELRKVHFDWYNEYEGKSKEKWDRASHVKGFGVDVLELHVQLWALQYQKGHTSNGNDTKFNNTQMNADLGSSKTKK